MKEFILINEKVKNRAISFISKIPIDKPFKKVRITNAESLRTIEQNAKMWAMLSDISKQVVWHDMKLSKEDWKSMITAALKKYKIVPGIEGGFVVIGESTSKMSIADMIDVIEFAYSFGTEQNVTWSEKVDIPEWVIMRD